MPLTEEDIKRIESLGYSRNDFAIKVDGVYRLRNVNGRCFFLSRDNRCRIYDHRPIGCRIYPVIYDLEKGVVVDEICPKRDEIHEEDLKKVEPVLKELLRKIYGLKV
jgi:Fe-S-cluster containining protein